jgi:hypothetical protein
VIGNKTTKKLNCFDEWVSFTQFSLIGVIGSFSLLILLQFLLVNHKNGQEVNAPWP